MRRRSTLAGLALVVSSVSVACGGSSDVGPPPQADEFLEISDCRELERLISAEVDRINGTTDREIIDAATGRYQRIVAHRDSLC